MVGEVEVGVVPAVLRRDGLDGVGPAALPRARARAREHEGDVFVGAEGVLSNLAVERIAHPRWTYQSTPTAMSQGTTST